MRRLHPVLHSASGYSLAHLRFEADSDFNGSEARTIPFVFRDGILNLLCRQE